MFSKTLTNMAKIVRLQLDLLKYSYFHGFDSCQSRKFVINKAWQITFEVCYQESSLNAFDSMYIGPREQLDGSN
jgi:hypothetical protein